MVEEAVYPSSEYASCECTYTKFQNGCKKLDHQGYMEYMANYLITEGSVNCSLKRPPVQCHSVQNDTQGRVAMPMDLHLLQLIPRTDGSKRKPSRPCFPCNGSWSDIQAKGIQRDAMVFGVEHAKHHCA